MTNDTNINTIPNQMATTIVPKIVQIMQISDPGAESIGLSNHGLAKFPGTVHIVQPKQHDGRWVTGFDEHSSSFNHMPMDMQNAERAKARKLQEVFQTSLGVADLSATSVYWESFYIDLASLSNLNLNNPKHAMYWCVLRANGYVMPDSTQKGKPEYWDAKFYAHQPEFEASAKNSELVYTDKAIYEIVLLKENASKLLLITRLLMGRGITNSMGVEELYGKLRKWIDLKPVDNSKAFLLLINRDINDLAMEVTLDNAILFNVINFRNNVYNRGTIVLGRNREEVISYFQNPLMRGEYDSIAQEVREKESTKIQQIV